MPLVAYHVTASAGIKFTFADDRVDGWPIQVPLLNNQTFYVDPQGPHHPLLRLSVLIANGQVAAGTGSVYPTPGTQTAWYRQRSSVPGQTTYA